MQRRRFLTITAGATCTAMFTPIASSAMTRWEGVALGAEASITLDHPEADRLIALARAEIERLEEVFSLYRTSSSLAQLNANGVLAAPPFELLECLSLVSRVHATTQGAFDPTIQPLWAVYAEHAARGGTGLPPEEARASALGVVGWQNVQFDPSEIQLHPGAALSLNGIAQGFIADRVAALLRGEGLTDVLVNTGELNAIGGDPRGGPWRVNLRDPIDPSGPAIDLADASLATSAPLGTVFDTTADIGHILDPRTGMPAPTRWGSVTVSAPHAAVADALSTAFTLLDQAEIDAALAHWRTARVVHISATAL
ncbi:thiamine biosynthesis protein ApbE [Jannaschia sp. EhC01]|nr:thiamine biosynthesis protein ApbE [Jannaschia sp. EhC01]